jgi:isopenicillin N synthase-like dioxygenase
LINHGIPPAKIDAFRSAMCRFFALPYDTKLSLKRSANNARGYFDDELTKRKRDWKEALDVGVPGSRDWSLHDLDDKNASLDGYNKFPSDEECPNFREVVIEYFEECSELSNRLATLMTLALNNGENDEGHFLERMRVAHTSYLRMNYYPPCGGNSDPGSTITTAATDDDNLHNNGFSAKTASSGTLGISPHRDAGFLTILLQDSDCHSLQVARFEDDDHIGDDDRWVTVHPVPGSLTINTGDMAMICSNGRFRAPLHRVLTDPARKRYSAPYFYNPSYDELCRPFAGCCTKTNDEGASEDTEKNNKLQSLKYHPCLWGYFRALRFAGDLCGKPNAAGGVFVDANSSFLSPHLSLLTFSSFHFFFRSWGGDTNLSLQARIRIEPHR